MSKVNIPNFQLNNGMDFPALGLGTWLGLNDKMELLIEDAPKLIDIVSYAIDIGYRHIDTAHLYRVEPDIGKIVRKKIEEGVITRKEIFITTKVWNHNHRPEDVVKATKDSLRRLGLDYVDLILMHWPVSVSIEGEDEKIDYVDSWRGFEDVLEQGLAKAIGVSNFNKDQMQRLLKNCKVRPVVNQVEINLNLGQKELVDFCQQNDILIIAYTPFGKMIPSRFDPSSPATRYDDPTLAAIAKKYGKSVQQISLRYLYERGIAAIPKTLTKSRLIDNASIFDFTLDSKDVATLEKFDINHRTVSPPYWQNFQNYPFDKTDMVAPKTPMSLLSWKNGINQDID